MYQAKLLKQDPCIEEKVILEINGMKIIGFSNICPYNIEEGHTYPIEISLTILDDPEITEESGNKYGAEQINNSFQYILFGKVKDNKIDIGNNIKIEDDIFEEASYLNGLFIKIKVDRLAIEFI